MDLTTWRNGGRQGDHRKVIAQFRAGGEIEGVRRDRLVLLTTIGARTGLRRTTPMMFHRNGDRLLVIASNIGAPRQPDWYLNLVANPRVTAEVATIASKRWQ
jgi:deazaflavin-dependent oxidoreductase (nitroreductase family)